MIGGRRRNLRARLILGTAMAMLAVENRHADSRPRLATAPGGSKETAVTPAAVRA